jgi:hypothetical protein
MFKKISWCTVFILLSLTAISRAVDEEQRIQPGEIWTDTEGKPINAHGGGMIFYDETYYW